MIVFLLVVITLPALYKFELLPWLDKLRIKKNNFAYLLSTKKLNAIEGDFSFFDKGAFLRLNKQGFENYPSTLIVFFEQTDFKLRVDFDGKDKVYVSPNLKIGYLSDKECSVPKSSNKYFVVQYDIDGDGIDELLYGVIDKEDFQSTVEVAVPRYHPPLFSKDVNRPENWERLEDMVAYGVQGDVIVEIESNSLVIKRNFRDLYFKWAFVDGKVVHLGNA